MKRYIFPCLLIAALATACGSKQPAQDQKEEAPADTTLVTLTPTQLKNAGIEVGKAASGQVSGILKLQGSIDVPPQSTVSVSFPLGGYLKRTELLPGVHVRKGEVLGVLEDMQFIQIQQDYLSAREKELFAEKEYKRQQELNAAKASSDKVTEQAKVEMETQKINMRSLAQKLELIGINPNRLNAGNISKSVNILSPIDGFVSKVNVNIGKYTSPTDVLFELVNPKDIHLALDVFEKDVNQLAVGQKVITYTTDKPEKKYEAEIILISKNLNEDRMANVHCHFEQFDATLLPGMFMNAEVEVKNATGLTVKEEAVVRWQNLHYVFVSKGNNTFKMTPVTLGNTNGGMQHISSPGIDTQTPIVTKNAYALLMKLKNSAEED
ncbi:efflux RND transporter periplasmic adaptor subunit [Mucilaginibacter myungsuensis]|uniref:Efflux RND transporter periplasmic adaptor subunit n=1 Tax=Mucilaginibacter myungsuensis TaxID=649104 RepID=A0A929PWB2_9SPHI|nr:efflux RND transporter periplasmic adaptor subunit [Mucilaginibacter myungsuensis]MBE9662658.1 efflux RND transporter periplasmic adaptor subunit [Mucilaginibacter myungsuensis]MDN3598078.1 efflux RND transporter periplasmic adaptor subunit [Mucilaginibacter myungsuensis]